VTSARRPRPTRCRWMRSAAERENVRVIPSRNQAGRVKRAARTQHETSAAGTGSGHVDRLVASGDIESSLRMKSNRTSKRPVARSTWSGHRNAVECGVALPPARTRPAQAGCHGTPWRVRAIRETGSCLRRGRGRGAIPPASGIGELLADSHTGDEDRRAWAPAREGTIQSLLHGLARVWRDGHPSGRTSPVTSASVYERLVRRACPAGRGGCRAGDAATSAAVTVGVRRVSGPTRTRSWRPRCPFLGGAPPRPERPADGRPVHGRLRARPKA